MKMLSNRLLQLIWALVCVCVGTVNGAANIDILEPIVRVSPARSGDSLDLFGYSVILHQIAEPISGNFQSAIENTRIIVGAPNGTFPGGLPGLVDAGSDPVNNTGLVYQCPIDNGTCGAVGRDGSTSNPINRRLFDDQPDGANLTDYINDQVDPTNGFAESEQKTGQLIGQVLKSSGNYFLACAPLWTPISGGPPNNFDNRKPTGRCFLSGKDLSEFTEVRTCLGEIDQPSYGLQGENRCQLGFGATFFENAAQDTSVLLSGPGTETGIGRLYLYNDVSDPAPFTVGQGADLDSRGSSGINFPTVNHSSYEGWSLATGNIFGSSEPISFVSGMPRFDSIGVRGKVNVRSPNFTLFPDPNLEGEQIGDYFGHAVETADLNNDGFDEVIAGSPFFSPGMPDVGRVYVYENNNGVINETAIMLTGFGPMGRFGHSIINLGDVNEDNLADIAVGAPYQDMPSDNNAQGAVYIYYGNKDTVISRTPDQIISSSAVLDFIRSPTVTSLRSFGFSLGSGVDVDANGYTDLVVGAYDSQLAVVFRTLSIAMINFTLSTDNSTVQLVSNPSINITLCAVYSGRGLDNRPLNVSYRLTEERQIVRSVPVSRTTPFQYTGVLSFSNVDEQACDKTVVQFVPIKDAVNGLRLQDPVVMRLTFEAINRKFSENGELIDFRDFPLIRSTGEPTVLITPELNCTSKDINGQEVCRPDLSITMRGNTQYHSSTGRTNSSIVAGAVTNVEFPLRVDNVANDGSINAFLMFTLPDGIPFTFGNSSGISCNQISDTRQFRCPLPTYIPGNTGLDITLVWNVDSTRVVGTESNLTAVFTVGIPLGSSNSDTVPSNNIYMEALPVTAITSPRVVIPEIRVVNPLLYDSTLPVSPFNTPTNLGETFDIIVTVTNEGRSTIPNGRLDISVPVRAPLRPQDDNVVKYYIYVGNTLMPQGMGLTCDSEGVNPDNLNFTRTPPRRKRSIAKRQSPDSSAIVSESCDFDSPSMACQTFRCNISNFVIDQDFSVAFVGVIDRRFYSRVADGSTFNLRMFARFVSLDEFDRFEDSQSILVSERTIVVSPRPPEPLNIYLEVWLPIIGAVLAIVLIIILFACCIYCGFFRKKRLEQAKKDAEGEFEVRQVPPEEPAIITGEDKKGDLGEDAAPSKEDDIGDAVDLEENGGSGEGQDGEPEKDPEETSL
ncbi:integrin alpha-5-like [Halichondria panicea]|uniref:integrin alpha-5-like n=1 Tax=Halichondria panicea TaxID=6063 RepID=UPI00312B98C5